MGAETYVGGHDTERQLLAAEQKIADGAGKAFRLAGGPEQSAGMRRKVTGRKRTPRIPHRSSAGGRNQAPCVCIPAQATGAGGRDRSEPGDGDAAPEDGDSLAILGQLDESGELCFGFVDGDFHGKRL
jgi:hypothetical protein